MYHYIKLLIFLKINWRRAFKTQKKHNDKLIRLENIFQ